MRDNEWSRLFYTEGTSEGTEYIHLCDGVIITKDALKVIFYIQYVKLRKRVICI